jgi:aryl-alcohol dehydrogenase-like predicted oxidoreductase
MKYNPYTKSGPKVSEIGFGAWQLGNASSWSPMSDSEAIYLVHKAIDEGINFFDTAPNYASGNSERLLGEAIATKDRSKLVINTKFGHDAKDSHTDFSSSRIRSSLEGSLRRLKTDYVDSIILHSPERKYLNDRDNDHYEIFETLKKEGKILAYGASLDHSSDMIELIENTKSTVIAAFFNILHQDSRKAFELALKKDVRIIAKIPLDSGWLSGKYNQNSSFTGIRSRWSKADIINRAHLIDELRALPAENQTMSQMAIAFCASYPAIATVIPGCVNTDQLTMNINSVQIPMDEISIKRLESFYENKVRDLNLPW